MLVYFSSAQQNVTWKELTEQASKMESMVYKTTSDTSLKIYYQLPRNRKKRDRYPAIIWIHGGGWNAGAASIFFEHAAYFAGRGTVGISIEYRLIGKNKSNTIIDEITDCKSAIRFIKQHAKELQIDTAKIVVAGDSAGGYLAAATITLESFNDIADNLSFGAVPNAVILYNPCVNMGVFPHIKNLFEQPIKLERISNDTISFLKKNADIVKALSPLFNIKKNNTNALLLHGLNDKVIYPEQSQQFTDAMNQTGNNARLILLPDTRHAFVVPHYTASEEKVVNAVLEADLFLISLGYLNGKPNLVSGNDPNWLIRK
jgi:dipeptidyl aminopeptidase/acylaminoacyl peptidase